MATKRSCYQKQGANVNYESMFYLLQKQLYTKFSLFQNKPYLSQICFYMRFSQKHKQRYETYMHYS